MFNTLPSRGMLRQPTRPRNSPCHAHTMVQMRGDPVLGNKLRERRKALNLSQLDVAADIGIDRSHLANIEKGRHMPGRKTLYALASRLDLSLDFLASPAGSY